MQASWGEHDMRGVNDENTRANNVDRAYSIVACIGERWAGSCYLPGWWHGGVS
jgi:hypothetical protein